MASKLGSLRVHSVRWKAGDPYSDAFGNIPIRNTHSDLDWNQDRQRAMARIRYVIRNSGWARSLINRLLELEIGKSVIIRPMINCQMLGIDEDVARQIDAMLKARWEPYAYGTGRNVDAGRRLTFGSMVHLGARHQKVEGDALFVRHWKRQRGLPYNTCFKVIHPDRLSNPSGERERTRLRGGVERAEDGEVLAHHYRNAHPADYQSDNLNTWTRVPVRDGNGRQRIIHHFDVEDAEQTRGVSVMAAVVKQVYMLDSYNEHELRSAAIRAIFSVFIKTPYDLDTVTAALAPGSGQNAEDRLKFLTDLRSAFYDENPLNVFDPSFKVLSPSDDVVTTSAQKTDSNHTNFNTQNLREVAAAGGISSEPVSMNYTDANYSSLKAGENTSWRAAKQQQADLKNNLIKPMYALWVEETLMRGFVPLPPGAPSVREALDAYAGCQVITPGRGYGDGKRDREGEDIALQNGTSTIGQIVAEQGKDPDEHWMELQKEMRTWGDNHPFVRATHRAMPQPGTSEDADNDDSDADGMEDEDGE
ncbi:MAG: phage portal protein, partial [Pseudomonadota bacterium]